MNQALTTVRKQFKYDMIIFFREPFFALPILFLPGVFFILYAGAMAKQYGNTEGFARYIPMYMILISFLTVFFNIGTQYVTDKQMGIFKRLLLSPINLTNLILTYVLRGMVVSILGFFEMCAIAVFGFKIDMGDHLLAVFFTFILVVGIMLLLSMTLHGFFKNSRQVMPFTIIGFQYVLFASGMLMPIKNMALGFRILVYINPVYHMNNVLLNVWFHEPQNIANILALAGWVLLCAVLIRLQKGHSFDK